MCDGFFTSGWFFASFFWRFASFFLRLRSFLSFFGIAARTDDETKCPKRSQMRLPVGGDTENPGFCRRRAELRDCAYPEEPA